MQERIAIVGTGALGGYIGGNLAHHGFDVTFIDMWPENLEAIRTRGLELDGVTAEEKFTVKSAKTLHLDNIKELANGRPVGVGIHDARQAHEQQRRAQPTQAGPVDA